MQNRDGFKITIKMEHGWVEDVCIGRKVIVVCFGEFGVASCVRFCIEWHEGLWLVRGVFLVVRSAVITARLQGNLQRRNPAAVIINYALVLVLALCLDIYVIFFGFIVVQKR